MTEELKQKFSEFYKKRESFYESHKDMAEKIGFKDWQKNEMFQYYEKGATENGIQWHDLRKDPNDLPKKNKSYWVYIDCLGNKIYRSIVWQGCWLGWNCIPLAWCEEPQFKE